MGEKRKASAMEGEPSQPSSPYIGMFETFRAELDQHHDRRERVVKASRDVTAASKKMVRSVNASLNQGTLKAIQPHSAIVQERLVSLASELQSINGHRYHKQVSPGIQEWIESLCLQTYLETQQLLTYDEAAQKLVDLTGPDPGSGASSIEPLHLAYEDYLLGIFDATGELMRFAITNVATGIQSATEIGSGDPARTVLQDLQTLRTILTTLEAKSNFDHFMAKDVGSKLEVMLASVEKVERAQYNLVVRGSERPKGWIPDMSEPVKAEA